VKVGKDWQAKTGSKGKVGKYKEGAGEKKAKVSQEGKGQPRVGGKKGKGGMVGK
jgi:hypothetical protein